MLLCFGGVSCFRLLRWTAINRKTAMMITAANVTTATSTRYNDVGDGVGVGVGVGVGDAVGAVNCIVIRCVLNSVVYHT